ncbi:DJ-1/PfpI family protein [Cryobacterium sp. 5B3]|uniref:DJ-1/PfpI family protein n=1 Tax=Cryobacterium sp. 5B3 TaxID=3048586 RepID=UPI002AB57F09|nr:DJ-1/PfpI family protein [Cryobacterium sp. 5B3]MDY7542458.1 DJ-1/PfpI family protein [Cryobacterium sp. 5B3]MEB0275297.1 DJ-1/PfpI family protein [Cryobacterium sp. 5B3]
MSKIARRIGSITLATTLTITAFAAIAVTGLSQSSAETASAASLGAPPPGPGTEPLHGQFVVAVVLGQSGSDTADVFAPYDVLASSPDFFVYTIAASAAPAVVDGGLSVVPAHTFAEVAEGTAPTPDLVVVPAVNSPAGPEEAPAREFIATQYNAGARILGICAGSRLLAASGVLDRLRATSHWSRIAALRTSNPEVSWVTGQRYVQDGRVTTTGGVTSSIPGSLKVIADMAGDTEANRVGESIGYPGWKLDGPTAMPIKDFRFEDAAFFLNTAFPWGRPRVAVELKDGVDEIDAAALFEVYGYSQGATTSALSAKGFVTTRHGLVVKTSILDGATSTVVAGELGAPGSPQGFDAAFELLSRSSSSSVVQSVSKMIEYPLDQVRQERAPLIAQARTSLLLALGLLLAVGVGMLPTIILGVVRRRMRARA